MYICFSSCIYYRVFYGISVSFRGIYCWIFSINFRYNDDIIDFVKNKKFNNTDHCLFLDPPWTGTFYKLETNLDLYLCDINIIKIMKDTYMKYICIKTPHNYNFTELYKNFYNVVIYRLSGFYFIMIKK